MLCKRQGVWESQKLFVFLKKKREVSGGNNLSTNFKTLDGVELN